MSQNGNGNGTLKSFKDMRGRMAAPPTPAAKIKVIVPEGTSDRTAWLQMAAERVRERQAAARAEAADQQKLVADFIEWMRTSSLPFLLDVERMVNDPETGPGILDEIMLDEEGNEVSIGDMRNKLRMSIDEYARHCDDQRVSLPLLATEAIFRLENDPEITWERMQSILKELTKDRLIKENCAGQIYAWSGKRYRVDLIFESMGDMGLEISLRLEKLLVNHIRRLKQDFQKQHTAAQQHQVRQTPSPEPSYSEEPLTPDQFFHSKKLGKYDSQITEWRWRFFDQRKDEEDEIARDLKITFQRFLGRDGQVRMRVLDFSKQHQGFLDGTGIMNPDGWLDDGKKPAFADKLLRTLHAIQFPRNSVLTIRPDKPASEVIDKVESAPKRKKRRANPEPDEG